MSEPSAKRIPVPGPKAKGSELRHLAWWEWNETGNPQHPHVVVCVHGLTRQGRDFDTLARALAPHARVLCVDVTGRGQSDWLDDPFNYQVPVYAADLFALLSHLRAQHPPAAGALAIDWVGTSLGGLIGMALASQPGNGIRRLVLNDVGPTIQWEALKRIGSYVGVPMSWPTEQAAADYLWSISRSFGPHTPEQWLALSRPMLRQRDGRFVLHYDPAIAVPLRAMVENPDEQAASAGAAQAEQMMWMLYDQITAQTLLLRGAESDLLAVSTAQAMGTRGPRARLVEFAGVGHAPTLVAPDQVRVVSDFLLAEAAAPG